MSKDIIVNAEAFETRVALLNNNQLLELHIERKRDRGIVGNIYKGRVMRVLPGMQAAFVDIGMDRAAFLYVRDVLDDFDELKLDDARAIFNRDDQPIQDILQEGQEVVVQVAKEPIGLKGAQVTSYISLPGRYLVYLPTAHKIGISRRIESEKKRQRLKKILEKLLPDDFNGGFIIRTASEDRKDKDLRTDMEYLLKTWNDIQHRKRHSSAPSLLHQELPLAMRAVRDLFTDDFDRFIVDNEKLYYEILEFFQRFLPQQKHAVCLYDDEEPIFEHFGIELEISKALDRKVWLKSGGYITIDQTEALTAIDVNTGRFVGQRNFEETILKTNLEAVKEIVYQLRLRNIGGIIIIDFIDMESRADQEKVFHALEHALKEDKTKTTISKISELGLVEMTRKRVRDNLTRYLCEPCPYCEGKGYIKSKVSVCYEMFRELRKEAMRHRGESIVIYVHPAVAELLFESEHEGLEELEKEYNIKTEVKADENFHQEQYEFCWKREEKEEDEEDS